MNIKSLRTLICLALAMAGLGTAVAASPSQKDDSTAKIKFSALPRSIQNSQYLKSRFTNKTALREYPLTSKPCSDSDCHLKIRVTATPTKYNSTSYNCTVIVEPDIIVVFGQLRKLHWTVEYDVGPGKIKFHDDPTQFYTRPRSIGSSGSFEFVNDRNIDSYKDFSWTAYNLPLPKQQLDFQYFFRLMYNPKYKPDEQESPDDYRNCRIIDPVIYTLG
jgi:hypothetical protein